MGRASTTSVTVFADPAFPIVVAELGALGRRLDRAAVRDRLPASPSLLRRRFRFRGLYQALVFFPWAVSGFLIGILFRWMFNGEFGVINDLLRRPV